MALMTAVTARETAREIRAQEQAAASSSVTGLQVSGPLPSSVTGMAVIEQHGDWPLLQRIPMRMTASTPVPHFRVRDLLALHAGALLKTEWLATDDVLLRIGSTQLSWCEFEVVEERMAIRLTRLA